MAGIPTFEEMRVRLQPVWESEDNKSYIAWAGIFGSVGRGRAHTDSDVDVVLVMKEGLTGEPPWLEDGDYFIPFYCWTQLMNTLLCVLDLKEACGRDVSYIPIWREPKYPWMWGHVRIEALLSSRTVYGDPKDVEYLKREGLEKLDQAAITYDAILVEVKRLRNCVSNAQTYEASCYRP